MPNLLLGRFGAIVGSCLFVAVIVTTRGKPIESVTKSLYATLSLVCRAGACQASLFEVCIGELSISTSIMRLDHERLNASDKVLKYALSDSAP